MNADFLILTHLPSFYKVNLYNALAKKHSVHVIFLGKSSTIRSDDFIKLDFDFSATFLSEGDFERRDKRKSCQKLLKTLNSITYKKAIVGGWEQPEFWLQVYKGNKSAQTLCLESGFESRYRGFKALLKKLFLSRVSVILAAGSPQKSLAKHLSFSKPIWVTKGVGLFNQPKQVQADKLFQGRFLYVGRLSPEKNIDKLLQAMRKRPQYHLTIAGQGPQSIHETDNVTVLGHVPQNQLASLYQSHDVLLLPSLQEPWGLVVEEALFQGLPVIVSDKVGAKELVEQHQVGCVFPPCQLTALLQAMDRMAEQDFYQTLRARLNQLEFIQASQEQQVDAYERLIR